MKVESRSRNWSRRLSRNHEETLVLKPNQQGCATSEKLCHVHAVNVSFVRADLIMHIRKRCVRLARPNREFGASRYAY